MTLEDKVVLKEKNYHRLKYIFFWMNCLALNLKKPTTRKDYHKLFTMIFIACQLVDIYAHICYILRNRHSLFIMAESIFTMLQVLITACKVIYILFMHNGFYETLRLVETHELVDKNQILSQETPYNKKLREEVAKILDDCWQSAIRQLSFFMICCTTICSFYVIESQIRNAYNLLREHGNATLITPTPSLYPFWEDQMHSLPRYLIVTFIGASSTLTVGLCSMGFDGIFIILALHGVALIRILRKMAAFTTSPELPRNLRLNCLCQCADHFRRTFKFCRDVNELYLHITLIQFVVGLIILAVVLFQASVGLESNIITVLKMMWYAAAAGGEIFFFCLNGQFVSNEYEYLSNAFYECEWYNERKEFKQMINMMILRSNQPFQMKCSWFTTMSLPTLMSIANSILSYFLLLKNMVE